MRILLAFLCLTFTVLLAGSWAAEASDLPPCKGYQYTWNNCIGTHTYADEWIYVGEFMDGKRHGQGTYTWAEGDKYVGEWKDDSCNGQGTYTYADGSVKKGVWKSGELIFSMEYLAGLAELKHQAKKGNADSQVVLGLLYDKGVGGVPQDDYKAYKWYLHAAKHGHSDAQHFLGLMYYTGQYVSKNYKQALKWFLLSAEQGDKDAQLNLGSMYILGRGITKDYKTAHKWFSRSARQGNAGATYNLGLLYDAGNGVAKDQKTAIKFYQSAAEEGIRPAKKRLKELKSRFLEAAVERCLYENIDKIVSDAAERIVQKKCARELKQLSTEDLMEAYD